MSSRPGKRTGWRAAERGAGKAEAAVPGRGLRAGPSEAPSRRTLRASQLRGARGGRGARRMPVRARLGLRLGLGREGGNWRAGRRRREEEAAGVGEEAASRPAAREHLRRRRRPPGYAARTRRHPGAAAPVAAATVARLAACAGRPHLGPGSRGSSLLLAF